MKITDPGPDVIAAATNGELDALDTLLRAIQPGIFNLGVRMLGNRDDAADATQEILLKVVTHLASFRGEAAFSTWVFRIARNQLLTAATRIRESPEVSRESLRADLQAALQRAESAADHSGAAISLTPEDKAIARQIALDCTQQMLMALDREQRLAYVVDLVFGLSSEEASELLEISPAAYRQRLSRARAALEPFIENACGRINPQAACHCNKHIATVHRLPDYAPGDEPMRSGGSAGPAGFAPSIPLLREERAHMERNFSALVRMSNAAALFRAHPEYHAPDAMLQAIRSVLRAEGFLKGTRQIQ